MLNPTVRSVVLGAAIAVAIFAVTRAIQIPAVHLLCRAGGALLLPWLVLLQEMRNRALLDMDIKSMAPEELDFEGPYFKLGRRQVGIQLALAALGIGWLLGFVVDDATAMIGVVVAAFAIAAWAIVTYVLREPPPRQDDG